MPPALPNMDLGTEAMAPRQSTLSATETARDIHQRISKLKTSNFSQFKALMAKNSVLQWRQYRTNLAQILFPLSMIMLLLLFQVLIDSLLKDNPDFSIPSDLNPVVFPIIPTLGYGVRNTSQCSDIPAQNMTNIATFTVQELYLIENQPPGADPFGTYSPVPFFKKGYLGNVSVSFEATIGSTKMSIPGYIGYFLGNTRAFNRVRCLKELQLAPISFNTTVASKTVLEDLLYEWWTTYTKAVLGAVEVNDLRYQSHQASKLINYTVITNKTLSNQHEDGFWMNIMNTAFVKSISGDTLKFTGHKNVPRPDTSVVFDLASLMGPFLLIYVFQLLFPVTLSSLVFDREEKLLEIMKMMGLKSSIYWIVTYIFNYLLYIIAIGLMYGLGYALDISIFSGNDPSVLIIGFLIWGNTQIALSFFASVFFSRSKTSLVMGYFYVFGSGLVASQVVSDYFTNDATPRSTLLGLQAFPPFVLYRMLVILSNNVAFSGGGLKLADIADPDVGMDEVWIIMAVQYVVFMILALYLDSVWPKSFGVRKHPLFFLKKSFWVGESEENINIDEVQYPAQAIADSYDHEPDDVAKDRAGLKSGPRNDLLLKILDITKVFSNPGGGTKTAVDRLSLGIGDKCCFGFLGQNGAGKTTLINMICGLIEPTSGTAYIGPLNIKNNIDQIHIGMGVCPQDNILWEDLTAREHLLFYGRLKNLSGIALEDAVARTLVDVNLTAARNKKSGEYSGGMQRRLSVACALIGDPIVVLLDEPTTGLDPASRRKLWDVIREHKRKCLYLLTTHSMEEAEALCDRLCILDRGRLLCVGTGPELKSRFGTGFKLTIIVEGGKEMEKIAVEKIMNVFTNASVTASLGGVIDLELRSGDGVPDVKVGDVFDTMELIRGDPSYGIKTWGIESSTLETTFLKVVGALDTHTGGGENKNKEEWV